MTMSRISLGSSSVTLSRVVLGGHEYLDDGRSRAFNEDLQKAVTPGHLFPGFGGPQRLAVVRQALELGITSFDVTIDSEKEALARNLDELSPPVRLIVQTRPESMVYSYDPQNRKLITPGVLHKEIERILVLLRRDRLDILNVGILQDAIDSDPKYIHKLTQILQALKDDGLIECAAADTFSGATTYLQMIRSGVFETINLNFSFADKAALEAVIPAARSMGVRVVAREVFIKGALFNTARKLSLNDTGLVARAAIKWVAQQTGIDALIIGVDTPEQLNEGCAAVANPEMTTDEERALEIMQKSAAFQALKDQNHAAFVG